MTDLVQPGLSKSGLIDLYGRPLNVASAATKAEIAEVVARPTTTGVRQAWNNSTVAAGLTPGRLASMLQRAADGDAHDYLTLAEEMEERDWHYASELGKRKLAVMGLDRNVKPASADPRDIDPVTCNAIRMDTGDGTRSTARAAKLPSIATLPPLPGINITPASVALRSWRSASW